MNSFAPGRKALPPLIATAVLMLVISAVFAATASAISVKLRIEGSAGTVFNGNVNTGPRSLNTTASSSCTNDGGSVAATKATSATALADWADAQTPAVAYNNQYDGSFICQIGAETSSNSEYWLMKINNRAVPPPKGYVTAGDELFEGDSVLLYWTDDYAKDTLDIAMSAAATAGVPVNGDVNLWNSTNDAKSAATGASVSSGALATTTNAAGAFSLTFPAPGIYPVSAAKSGVVRGSSVVAVAAAGSALPPQPLVKINRFVKCNKTYRKASKKHRRCVRIVRAKQAAAKQKQS